jgi:hypothetical protein
MALSASPLQAHYAAYRYDVRWLLALTHLGFLACPCHVPLTLPLLAALFGGIALGAWLSTHTGLVIRLSTSDFLAAIVLDFWLLNRRSPKSGMGAAS